MLHPPVFHVGQACVLQAWDVAGLVPVHRESETVLAELSLHWTVLVWVPPAHALEHEPHTAVYQE